MYFKKTKLVLAVVFIMIVTMSLGASAQNIWTAAADTCAVDEDSLLYYVDGAAYFTMNNSTPDGSTVTERCMVVNPMDGGSTPGWGHLTLGFYDPGAALNSYARAILYYVPRKAPFSPVTEIMRVTSTDVLGGYGVGSNGFGHVFDFTTNVYWVAVTVYRTTNQYLIPKAYYVSLEP